MKIDAPTTSFTINTAATKSSCTASTGSATITSVTGGNAPYIYKWNNGATTSSISNVPAGTYTVTITDGSSCSQSKDIIVAPASTITDSLSATTTACGLSDGSAKATNVSGGTAPYTYLWNTGATASSLSNLGGGTYIVTITDAAGCKNIDSAKVRALGTFVIATETVPSACIGSSGSATVTSVTGGNPPYTYIWSNGSKTNSIVNVAAGTYTVTVFDARNCEMASSPVMIKTNSNIVLTPSVSNATCGKINGQIALTTTNGAGGYTYNWADLTGTGQPRDRTNLSPGTYSVTVNDVAGCGANLLNIRIVDTGAIKAQVALQPQGCVSNGDTVVMRLTNNTTAQSASFTSAWLFTGNRTSIIKSPDVPFGTIEGETRLIVRSAEGCLDTLTLRFPLDVIKVAISPTSATTCINTPSTITVANQNPNFIPKFKWDNGDTTLTRTITPTTGGITRAILTTTNTYGCIRKDTINVNAIPNLTPPDLSWKRGCEPFKITFSNTNANADQWVWRFGDPRDTARYTGNNPSYTYSGAGNYTVTVSPKSLACLNTLTLNVTVSDKAAVLVNAGRDTTVCTSDRLTLRATSSAGNFEWSNNPLFSSILGTGATLLVTPIAGSNTYFVRSKDTSGCTAIDTVVVDNRAVNIAPIASLDICGGVDKPIIVTNLNAGDRLSVVWSPSGLISGFTGNDSLRPIIRANADGTLTGTFKNQFGCTSTSTIAIKARSFDAKADANIKAIYANDVVTLTATPTGSGYTYLWSPTVNNPTAATTNVAPTVSGTYTVTVTDAFGCKDTGQVFLRVMVPQCAEPYIFIPRAFSPNGDGKNDVIFVHGDYLRSVEFVIFNRWGEQVFSNR